MTTGCEFCEAHGATCEHCTRDELERLRAALVAITQEIPTFLLTNETGAEVYRRHVEQVKTMHAIANEALALHWQDSRQEEK